MTKHSSEREGRILLAEVAKYLDSSCHPDNVQQWTLHQLVEAHLRSPVRISSRTLNKINPHVVGIQFLVGLGLSIPFCYLVNPQPNWDTWVTLLLLTMGPIGMVLSRPFKILWDQF